MIKQLPIFYSNYCISSGTLRNIDLFKAFFAEIHDFMGYCNLDRDIKKFVIDAIENIQPELLDEEELSQKVEIAFDILESIAPEGCYFGTLEGDGACFGFWSIEEI